MLGTCYLPLPQVLSSQSEFQASRFGFPGRGGGKKKEKSNLGACLGACPYPQPWSTSSWESWRFGDSGQAPLEILPEISSPARIVGDSAILYSSTVHTVVLAMYIELDCSVSARVGIPQSEPAIYLRSNILPPCMSL